MRRLVDWDTRLAAWLEEVRDHRFGWDRAVDLSCHDCCTFAAAAVEAMTGEDPMPEFRGRYRTQAGAARALRLYGAGTLAATLDGKFARVAHPLAQRGDLVMTGGLLSVCLGRLSVAIGAEGDREGLVSLDRAGWADPIAWRVPY